MLNQKNSPTKLKHVTPPEQERADRLKSSHSINRDMFHVIDKGEASKAIEPNFEDGLSSETAYAEFRARVYAATGASSQEVGINLLTQACEAVAGPNDSAKELVGYLNTISKTMQALEPRDEIEGQLLAQLAVLHQQSMSWLGRAMRTERVNFANIYLNSASKLLTRHHEALATLMKYRRGGEQRVHVEHVHIHDGGKAIIGNVYPGIGVNQKI